MTNQEAIKILDNLKPGDYSNPYEKGEAIVMAIEALQAQPSAQSEIIRCRDCKHYYFADNRIPQEQRYTCELDGDRWKPDDYCSFAERRTDD